MCQGMNSHADALDLIRDSFAEQDIGVSDIQVRSYPEETNFIVLVAEEDLPRAVAIGNDLDDLLADQEPRAFVVVRKGAGSSSREVAGSQVVQGVQDARVTDLTRLISARSRVSLSQPSLSYVRDAESNLASVTAERHHLIFGRRGAGKSALLVEARKHLENEGAVTAWVNVQTLRHEGPERVFLYVLEEIIQSLLASQRLVRAESVVSVDLTRLYENVRAQLATDAAPIRVESHVPMVQRTLRRFLDIEGLRLFVFIDDFYYLSREYQPRTLDLLNGCVRDCPAWFKVASIRHLTRWFQSSPPMGLQTIHDTNLIDLDITLQDPERVQEFLENVLLRYARHVGINTLKSVFSSKALDRMVLASGGVPRDYLVLASGAVSRAQGRQNASLVGAQDVNQAAGDATGAKLQELEEDMASNIGTAERTLRALKVVRDFCLEERSYTYFLVGFRDKEERAVEYSLLTDLMDVRLVHLLDSGVSDQHAAGQRSEAFLLDLSQYSGARLKQRIRVLDFTKGKLVSRETRAAESTRVGGTPLQVISMLRVAPAFSLERLELIAGE